LEDETIIPKNQQEEEDIYCFERKKKAWFKLSKWNSNRFSGEL